MAFDFSQFESTAEEDALFDKAPFDSKAGRKKLVARFDRTERQVRGALGKQGGTDFERGHNNGVRFKPTINGHRVYLKPEREAYFGSTVEKFPDLIKNLIEATNAGHFDDQLEAALTSPETAVPATKATRKASGDKPAPLSTLTSVKQSATRLKNTGGKSVADIRKYLEEKQVQPDWIEAAIKNLP